SPAELYRLPRPPARFPGGRHADQRRAASRLRVRLHLDARAVVARPGARPVGRGSPPTMAHRLFRGGRAARAPRRARAWARRPPLARAADLGARLDHTALHARSRRADLPGLASPPPLPIRRRAARLLLPR